MTGQPPPTRPTLKTKENPPWASGCASRWAEASAPKVHTLCLSFSGLKGFRPGSAEKRQRRARAEANAPNYLSHSGLQSLGRGVRPPGLGIRGAVRYPRTRGSRGSPLLQAGSDYRSLGLAGLGSPSSHGPALLCPDPVSTKGRHPQALSVVGEGSCLSQPSPTTHPSSPRPRPPRVPVAVGGRGCCGLSVSVGGIASLQGKGRTRHTGLVGWTQHFNLHLGQVRGSWCRPGGTWLLVSWHGSRWGFCSPHSLMRPFVRSTHTGEHQ